jgi:hypothetical protein
MAATTRVVANLHPSLSGKREARAALVIGATIMRRGGREVPFSRLREKGAEGPDEGQPPDTA